MNKKGQAVLSEYVMVFFVAIAAVVAMITFVQRGLQAKIHDTRNYVIDTLANSGACDVNCMAATGSNQISYEYEPYYAQMVSDSGVKSNDSDEATSGNQKAIRDKFYEIANDVDTSTSNSVQLPPCASANPVPAWCGKPGQ